MSVIKRFCVLGVPLTVPFSLLRYFLTGKIGDDGDPTHRLLNFAMSEDEGVSS